MIAGKERALAAACVAQARAIIAENGVERLSLREVARRLGVSHQAPYKHYANRDALLAEVVAQAYADFAAHLDARERKTGPFDDLSALGRAYLAYALNDPLSYRLMFGTPLPDPDLHPHMMREARHAFSILRGCLTRIGEDRKAGAEPIEPDMDALFVWCLIHGMASILQTSAITTLDLPANVLAVMEPHFSNRLMAALGARPVG